MSEPLLSLGLAESFKDIISFYYLPNTEFIINIRHYYRRLESRYLSTLLFTTLKEHTYYDAHDNKRERRDLARVATISFVAMCVILH